MSRRLLLNNTYQARSIPKAILAASYLLTVCLDSQPHRPGMSPDPWLEWCYAIHPAIHILTQPYQPTGVLSMAILEPTVSRIVRGKVFGRCSSLLIQALHATHISRAVTQKRLCSGPNCRQGTALIGLCNILRWYHDEPIGLLLPDVATLSAY
jgi:hypothetical protein